jgi:hypothetical protein
MQKITMEVNKKNPANAGKYEKVGEVTIFVPMLHEVFPDVKQAKDSEGKELVEDGLPVYEDEKHNYIQGAILAAVKAQARNKLKPSTATLKDGQKIAEDWEALTAEGERGNNGAALAIMHECKKAFASYVASLNKSAAAQQTLNLLFGNKQALALQSSDTKGKIAGYVTSFAETLNEEQLAKYERYITGVLSACEETESADDL